MKLTHSISAMTAVLFFSVCLKVFADAPADAGGKLYATKCASCHAKTGKGNAAMAKVFKVEPAALDMAKKATLDKSDADLAKTITDGVNKMPAYKGKLTDADIKGLVAYLRTLPSPAAAPKTEKPAP